MNERKGDWFLTYTGRQFWPLDPQPEDICIRDIAHHLSLICRFNGACRSFYSVAQHSVLVASILPQEAKLFGLLHDATEAYVGDMVRPLKRMLPAYQDIETNVWAAVKLKFNLAENFHITWPPFPLENMTAKEGVKRADNILLATERRDLMIDTPKSWSVTEKPIMREIIPWDSRTAEIRFLEAYDELIAQNS